MKILCNVGMHSFTKWNPSFPKGVRMSIKTYPQTRECTKCGKKEERDYKIDGRG